MCSYQTKMVPLRPVSQQRVRYAMARTSCIPSDSKLSEILKPKAPVHLSRSTVPIMHHTYKEDLKRADMILGIHPMATQQVIDQVKVVPRVDKVHKKEQSGDTIISQVVPAFKVKGDKVMISLSCPIEKLHIDYYSKGVMPPLKERILAYSKIGYSDSDLAKMIKTHDNWQKNLSGQDKFIETIFGDANKKKTTATKKKKTLLQMIGYKKPKYATVEDDEPGDA